MKYIDIHCHLDRGDYGEDFGNVLERMKENDIGAITIGADLETSKKAVEIAEANQNIWACVGVHPDYLTPPPNPLPLIRGGGAASSSLSPVFPSPDQGVSLGWDPSARLFETEQSEAQKVDSSCKDGHAKRGVGFEELEKLIKHPKVVGVGECGLDYFERRSLDEGGLLERNEEIIKNLQKEFFKQHIDLALKYDKPLMLHIRSSGRDNFLAYFDTINILKEYKKDFSEKLRGNVHFFAGNLEVAKEFLDLGFSMSFTGVITFTHDYDEVIKFLPQDKIMSETDAPWVAPVPYRSKRNEPAFVIEIIKKMAEIRDEDLGDLNLAIINNAKNLFGLSDII